jgi:hypothetical protein
MSLSVGGGNVKGDGMFLPMAGTHNVDQAWGGGGGGAAICAAVELQSKLGMCVKNEAKDNIGLVVWRRTTSQRLVEGTKTYETARENFVLLGSGFSNSRENANQNQNASPGPLELGRVRRLEALVDTPRAT